MDVPRRAAIGAVAIAAVGVVGVFKLALWVADSAGRQVPSTYNWIGALFDTLMASLADTLFSAYFGTSPSVRQPLLELAAVPEWVGRNQSKAFGQLHESTSR